MARVQLDPEALLVKAELLDSDLFSRMDSTWHLQPTKDPSQCRYHCLKPSKQGCCRNREVGLMLSLCYRTSRILGRRKWVPTTKPYQAKEGENKIIDASAYFAPGCGSQFEGNPLPSSRLCSSLFRCAPTATTPEIKELNIVRFTRFRVSPVERVLLLIPETVAATFGGFVAESCSTWSSR